jgi:hypothetical protein
MARMCTFQTPTCRPLPLWNELRHTTYRLTSKFAQKASLVERETDSRTLVFTRTIVVAKRRPPTKKTNLQHGHSVPCSQLDSKCSATLCGCYPQPPIDVVYWVRISLQPMSVRFLASSKCKEVSPDLTDSQEVASAGISRFFVCPS